MSSTVKNALTGGAVVGGSLLLIVSAVFLALVPLLIGAMWYFGLWSFEYAVIALLILACYAGGSE